MVAVLRMSVQINQRKKDVTEVLEKSSGFSKSHLISLFFSAICANYFEFGMPKISIHSFSFLQFRVVSLDFHGFWLIEFVDKPQPLFLD